MRDINEVLRAKEAEIAQLQKEIECLRTAARLLADDSEPSRETGKAAMPSAVPPSPVRPSPSPTPVAASAAPRPGYSAAWENAPKQFP